VATFTNEITGLESSFHSGLTSTGKRDKLGILTKIRGICQFSFYYFGLRKPRLNLDNRRVHVPTTTLLTLNPRHNRLNVLIVRSNSGVFIWRKHLCDCINFPFISFFIPLDNATSAKFKIPDTVYSIIPTLNKKIGKTFMSSSKTDRIILAALSVIFSHGRLPSPSTYDGYASLKQLQEETGLSKAYIVTRLNALIAQGYLNKASDIADHGGHLTNFFTILKPLPPLTEEEQQQLMSFRRHNHRI
jgi:hypothetical protein